MGWGKRPVKNAGNQGDERMDAAEIIRIHQETPTVKSFRLGIATPTFSFLPGQWVDLYIDDPDEGEVIGGFSITSSPLHRDYIDLAIKKIPDGRASVYLHERVQVGDGVTIDGGYGDFYYRKGMSQALVLIAGGIGITPLMSMMRLIDEASLSELVFYEELQAIAARHANVRSHFTVTQPGNASWDGRVGHIDRELLGAQAMVPNALYYLCGPRGFAEDMEGLLTQLGVGGSQMRREAW
jgi:ferredoxin-NADP reductase